MLRLRAWIERAGRRRRLGLVVLLCLAVLLVLVALHPVADEALEVVALGCLTLILFVGPLRGRLAVPPPTRAPRASFRRRASTYAGQVRRWPLAVAGTLPLRL